MNGKLWITSQLAAAALLCAPALMLAQNTPSAAPATSPSGSGAQSTPAEVFNKLLSHYESEVVSAAEAMPDDKYTFTPTSGEFKGVRNFGEQVKHVAQVNYMLFSAFGVSGGRDPKSLDGLTTKTELVQALKDSFAYAHRAVDSMTPANAFEQVQTRERQGTRIGMAATGVAHLGDHYGQMVEYLRMNGIVPPASRK